ncbi:hypothetical protein RR46_12277 [Papilio xuthus]|uniref:Uncharacterized protein n=1 Tax=Papilio xuthus TaxID=66420 RepID=A0A194PSF9_PAPXU|nr:hypothetical protein RR46_12277 [Papilio xuthus]
MCNTSECISATGRDLVRDPVRDLVRDLVGDLVGDLVRDLVGDLVRDLVGDLVGDLVRDLRLPPIAKVLKVKHCVGPCAARRGAAPVSGSVKSKLNYLWSSHLFTNSRHLAAAGGKHSSSRMFASSISPNESQHAPDRVQRQHEENNSDYLMQIV